jgi:putative lipoic acid-binding regulatory protein
MDNSKYKKLKELLSENKNWPMSYMFKCIIPNRKDLINRVVALLPYQGEFSFKNSKNNKFVSVSCVAQMNDAQKIIDITKSISEIPDVMIL